MTFFSTPERIEIGGVPFIASHEKPTRRDGLLYYRRVAEHFGLDARPGEEVTSVTRADERFELAVKRRHDSTGYTADNVVFATGYYDWPNRLGIPGEDLPHVAHYFTEGHRHWHQRVVVIGEETVRWTRRSNAGGPGRTSPWSILATGSTAR